MIHVLYVDDEPEQRDLGKIFLERSADLSIDTAASAQDALDMLRTGSYDAVVADYQMPGMDGIALLKEIRAEWGNLPFILFTGRGRKEIVIEALNNGADFYLQKGSDVKPQFMELHHMIVQAVGKRESEEKFRTLVEESLVGIYLIQGDRFLHVNPRFAEMFGYSVPEIIGTLRVEDLVAPEDRDLVMAKLRLRFLGEATSLHYAFRGRRRDGSDIDVEVAGTRTLLNGQPIVVGTILDARGLRKMDCSLLLENRKNMLFNMLIRHDIANRLTVLRGRLKVLQKQSKDPALLQQIRSVDHAGRDIFDLLESARHYQEIGLNTPRWQNVREMISRAVSHTEMPTLNISLAINGLEICADPLCDRVFANLLDNTLRHGGHATEVRVWFRRTDEGAMIVWEDNGVGIPAELKSRVFEEGYGTNTGLGLFLCREILSGTGISLHETGIPGNGARFEISLPEHAWRCSGSPLTISGDHQIGRSNTSS